MIEVHNLSLSEILQSLPIRRGEEIILVFSELKGLLNTAHSPYSDKEYPPLPLRWMPEVVPCPRREGKEEKWRAGRGRRRNMKKGKTGGRSTQKKRKMVLASYGASTGTCVAPHLVGHVDALQDDIELLRLRRRHAALAPVPHRSLSFTRSSFRPKK
ncbi:hypothetical protein BHM03_00046107 [Ensete ventricosum]|nr:hypothetical protein BHM03_00046107 [Ensete ventricosum]